MGILLLIGLKVFEILLEKGWVFLILHESLIADLPGLMKIDESMLHQDLTILSSCLHHRVEMTDISIHDDILTRISIDEYFSCDDMSRFIFAWKDDLSDDAGEDECELDTHLRLHRRRKGIDETIESLDHVIGMEGRYDEVSCLCECEYRRDRLLIAHLSDDEDIWIFTHSISHRLIERCDMFSDLLLMDEAFFISNDVFDRIFDDDDMFVRVFIEIVDHSHQSRRLSASRTSCDKDQSTIFLEELQDVGLEPDTFSCRDFFFDRSESDTESFIILRDIRTESRPLVFIDEVDTCWCRFDLLFIEEWIHENDQIDHIFDREFPERFDRLDATAGRANIREMLTSDMKISDMIFYHLIDELDVFIDEWFIGHGIKVINKYYNNYT